jgi:DNA-binding GntR family transcriptional regulator
MLAAEMPPLSRRTSARAPARRASVQRDGATAHERTDHVSRAYGELRSLIVWGQLPPGARIAERTVADRLGLSRTPVRSALHRLQQEGLISSSGRGRDQRLIVAPLTQDDAREVFCIVGHLEGLAARTAALLPLARRREVVRRLRAVNRELASASRTRSDAVRVFDLDLEFHRTYVEGVVGPRLLAMHRSIRSQSERYTRLYLSALLDEMPTSVREHDATVRGIAQGDPDAAQHAAEVNWRNAADRLTQVIAQHGERGAWHAWG